MLVAYIFGKTPGEIIEPVAVDPQRIGELAILRADDDRVPGPMNHFAA